MTNILKNKLIIIPSGILVLAIIANIIVACINVDNLPSIDYSDVPETNSAASEYSAAKEKNDNINSEAEKINKQIAEKQNTVNSLEEQINELNTLIEEMKLGQGAASVLEERYEKCEEEARRLLDNWSVYREMSLDQITANYDSNNLRSNQNISNIYSVVGEHTGFLGGMLSQSIDRSIYDGFDKVIAAVDSMTVTANEHLNQAALLLSRIKSKISFIDPILAENLNGEELLFEVELFESAYYGNDDLFETERKELVHELSYSKAVLDALYPVFQMMLSKSDTNTEFLNKVLNQKADMGNYINSISKTGDDLLSPEEIGEITYSVYQLFPEICEITTDPTYSYKDVEIRTTNVSNGFGYKPDELYQGYKYKSYNEKCTFMLRQRDKSSGTVNKEFYYSPDGNLLYGKTGYRVVCLDGNGHILYTNVTEAQAEEIVSESKEMYLQYNK